MPEQSVGTLSNQVIGDPERRRLLVVDDEETIRLALSRFLRTRGYDVDSAGSGEQALACTAEHRYAAMICDVRMPGMSGMELLPHIRQRDPDVAIMMLTAVNDAPTAAESLALGAMEYLMKPIELAELQQAVERVLHRRSLEIEQRNVERIIVAEVGRRTSTLEQDRSAAMHGSLDALAMLVALHEAKDPFLMGTSARVAAVARAIGEELGADEPMCNTLALTGKLHDIGRLTVRESVLNKPGPLSPEEFEHVKDHVLVGIDILSRIPFVGEVLTFTRDHHEHWDGSGYPRGIAGEHISRGGRVLCAADAFVALTSRRAYRPSMPPDDTVDYLAAHAGGLLEPIVHEALRVIVLERRVLGLTAD